MKVFNIKHEEQAIHLETSHTKFGSLERLIIVADKEFIHKGKKDQLKRIIGLIEAYMV